MPFYKTIKMGSYDIRQKHQKDGFGRLFSRIKVLFLSILALLNSMYFYNLLLNLSIRSVSGFRSVFGAIGGS
jgi:hypothetical protein